jgi:hypothetical protein
VEKTQSSTDGLRVSILTGIHDGKSVEEIQSELIKNGMDTDLSKEVVSKIAIEVWKSEKEMWDKKYKSAGILIIVGLVLTFGTFALASGGGIYLLAWGPILFGGIRIFEAHNKSEKLKEKINGLEKPNLDQNEKTAA